MTKKELIKLMVEHGYNSKKAKSMINSYKEILAFTYMSVYNPNGKKSKSHCNYKKAFDNAYLDYGLYIFYEKDNNEILYIGEAAEEEFKDRLSQHFNESDGGLRKKLSSKPDFLYKLENSEVLILYGKHNKNDSRSTHFDEDLLIGLFRPVFNDR